MEDTSTAVLQIDSSKIQAYTIKQAKDASYLTCETCNKVFSRTWLLKNHMRVHTGERPYKCSFCDKAFADKSNLRQHMKIHTTKEKLFLCGICKRTFAQRRYLAKHVSEIHRQSSLNVMVPPSNRKKAMSEVIVQQGNSSIVRSDSVKLEHADKSADHQYLTRNKTKVNVPVSEGKTEAKYSEQDLKDFIKSSSRTMEKNGYMFIKHNFVSMDTEPSLTEISETGEPKTQAETSPTKPVIVSKMVPVQTTNGKVVYRKDNKSSQTVLLQSPEKSTLVSKTVTLSSPQVKRTNLKTGQGQVVLMGKNNQVLNSAGQVHSKQNKLLQSSKNVQIVQPFQLVQSSLAGNQSYFQVLPQAGMSLVGGSAPIQLIPVSLMPGTTNVIAPQSVNSGFSTTVLTQSDVSKISQPISNIPPQSISNVSNQPILEDSIMTSQTPVPVQLPILSGPHSDQTVLTISDQGQTVSNSNIILSSSNTEQLQLIDATEKHELKSHIVDERGDHTIVLSETQTAVQTPIVSDAPWQGVLNINSEQELLDFINSQSQSVIHSTGLDGDKGMTIYIQNVDPNIGTITPLAVDVLQEPFSDQGTIMSEVMPVASNMEEVGLNPAEGSLLVENGSLLHIDPTPSSMVAAEDAAQLSISEHVFTTDNHLSVNPGVDDESLKLEINVADQGATDSLYSHSADTHPLDGNEAVTVKSETSENEIVFLDESNSLKSDNANASPNDLDLGISNSAVEMVGNTGEMEIKPESGDSKQYCVDNLNDLNDIHSSIEMGEDNLQEPIEESVETKVELKCEITAEVEPENSVSHEIAGTSKSLVTDEREDENLYGKDLKNTDHDLYSAQLPKSVTIETIQDRDESMDISNISVSNDNCQLDRDNPDVNKETNEDEVNDNCLQMDLNQDPSDDNCLHVDLNQDQGNELDGMEVVEPENN